MSYCSIQCLGYFIQLLIKGQKFSEDVHIWGFTEEKGKKYSTPFLCSFPLFCCICISLAVFFVVFVLCVGLLIQFWRGP